MLQNDLILDGIAAQCAEIAVAQCVETGGRHAFHYIGMDEARKIIRGAILTALRRQHDVEASKQLSAENESEYTEFRHGSKVLD